MYVCVCPAFTEYAVVIHTLQLGADGGELGHSENCTSHPHLLLLCSQCSKPHTYIPEVHASKILSLTTCTYTDISR